MQASFSYGKHLSSGLSKGNGPGIKTKEIERKWLVEELPDLTRIKGKDISQGYIAMTSDGTEVRIRQKGKKFYQTVKNEGDLVRGEVEIELTRQQFTALWETTEGRRLEKIRYEINSGGIRAEIDIYKGNLTGLIIVEVEFSSVSDSDNFIVPSWFGREVTKEKGFKNKNLALNGLSVRA